MPGRKYQLRIHCARALSCPIAGDRTYGPARASKQQRALRAQSSEKLKKPEPFMEHCEWDARARARWGSFIKDVLQDLQKMHSSSANDSAVKDEFQQLLTDAEGVLSMHGGRLPGRVTDLMLHARVLSISKPGQVCRCSLHSQQAFNVGCRGVSQPVLSFHQQSMANSCIPGQCIQCAQQDARWRAGCSLKQTLFPAMLHVHAHLWKS